MVATSCDLNVPRCTTKGQQVRLHGSREVSSLITEPPVIPCCNKNISYMKLSCQRSFTSVQTFHTHTPCLRKGGLLANEVKERLKREWRWYESEDEMKNYPTGTRGGERKREGGGKHRHQHTWPGAGKPWKGKGKEKRRPTDTEKDQRRGEGRKCLNQPTTAKPTPT